MTIIIGITGGIGSGKSTLCKYFIKKGFPVYDSDKVVSEIYKKPNKSFLDLLIKNNLNKAVKNGKINKKLITSIFFNDQKIKNSLQKYIHKKLRTSRERFIKKNTNTKKKAIFLDIPLLFENNLEKSLDHVVCIISTKKIRAERVLKNKKFSKEILNKIFNSQTSDKERRKRSQTIIYNNKTKKDFILNAQKVLIRVLK